MAITRSSRSYLRNTPYDYISGADGEEVLCPISSHYSSPPRGTSTDCTELKDVLIGAITAQLL